MAEQFSSSLANIAASSMRRRQSNSIQHSRTLQHQPSSLSSSSDYAGGANIVSTGGSSGSNNDSNNSGSGEDRESGGDDKKKAPVTVASNSSCVGTAATAIGSSSVVHHHHHHHHTHSSKSHLKQAPPSMMPLTAKAEASTATTTQQQHFVRKSSSQGSLTNHKTAVVARKKRPHPTTMSSSEDMDVKMPAVDTAIMTMEADEENSSGSGTEAGYAGSNENQKSSQEESSSGASSNSPMSSSNDDDIYEDEDDDISLADTTDIDTMIMPTPLKSAPLTASSTMQDSKMAARPTSKAATITMPIIGYGANSSAAHMAAASLAKLQFSKISRVPSSLLSAKRTRRSLSSTLVTTSSVNAKAVIVTTTKPAIMTLGSDLMAHVLTFLEPPDILEVLTMPLSKEWQSAFAGQQELWRILCLLEPFKAKVEEDFSSDAGGASSSSSSGGSSDEDDGSWSSFAAPPAPAAVWKTSSNAKTAVSSANSSNSNSIATLKKAPPATTATMAAHRRLRSSSHNLKHPSSKLGKYRLLYTSFVRCMKYLARIKEDVRQGRPPSVIDYGGSSVISKQTMGSNRSLQQFLAGARDVVRSQQQQAEAATAAAQVAANPENVAPAAAAPSAMPFLSADTDGNSSYTSNSDRRQCKRKKSRQQSRRKRPKFGCSMLTDRILAPTAAGEVNPENVTLPWSCALYSIVNWMVAFADVEGIQIMCLKVLPMLLEDEQQRITAQRVGLTDVILRGMVLFPNSVHLHTASFHTLVLLARPLGGREGMLFHSSMVNAAGIFSASAGSSDGSASGGQGSSMFSGGPENNGKSGIAVMLDSMRRFEDSEALQAMSCWSLVNIALAPTQKEVLVKLGGIAATTNAMMLHPHSAEVQFRALFALINLVIPSVAVADENHADDDLDEVNRGFAEELDEMVGQITNLVVLAMKNFCSSEAILNRACLVLHNLSLTQAYHHTLLWTPNCYQMLEWCLANYRTDQVLQQSAAGTLHWLQVTLSNDEKLRTKFAASIQAQQQLSLEAAHREAIEIYEQTSQRNQGSGSSSRRRGSTSRAGASNTAN